MFCTPLAHPLKLSPTASGGFSEAVVSPLKVSLFGTFEVLVEGQPLPRLRSRKGTVLFALLVLRANREVSRDWLVANLWPDSSEVQGRQSLRQSLADLRSALGSQAYRITSPTTQSLLFDAQGADIDALRFDALLRNVKSTPSNLEEAITLYRGTLMEGGMEVVLLQEQEIRRNAFLDAVDAYAKRVLSQEVSIGAISYVKRGILEDPLRESLYRHLMQLYVLEGDYAACIQVYRDLRLRLQEELNISPDAETTKLYQSLRSQARAKLQQEPPATQEKPTPDPTVSRPTKSVLPRPLMGLVGRETEREEIKTCIQKAPLVTLLGMGGVGKTRLTLQVARELAEIGLEVFEDGVFFVPLASITEKTYLLQSVASVLGVRESQNVPLQETLKEFLSTRSLLLILDNCEHLIDECAAFAETLLGGAVHLHILATSREPLGITGEVCYRLQPLPCPSSQHTPTEYQASPAVRLFLERGTLVKPGFQLTEQNAEQIATICRRLDGIPLAIELAAARLKMLSLEQILGRLEDRFSLLTEGSRTALPRHQTLRALIDWSYDLISEEEREVFCALSVFQGGFTLTAAEAVCGVEEILVPFSHLVDRSLIMVEESAFGEMRYRLLESLREYAAEKLKERVEEEVVQERFSQWAVDWLTEISKRLLQTSRIEWQQRIDKEYENLRRALQIAPPGDLKGRLVNELDRYWYMRSSVHEAEHWLLSALEGASSMTEATLCRVQGALGMTYWQKADNPSARKHLLEALRLAHKTGNSTLQANVGLGLVEAAERNYEEALGYYAEALRDSEERSHRPTRATVLSNMACLYLDRDEFEKARTFFHQSRQCWQEEGDSRGVVFEDLFLALLEERLGNDELAYQQYLPCLEQLHLLDDLNGIAWGLAFLTYVQVKRGKYLFAAKLTGALAGLRERLGIQANSTQLKAETESHDKMLGAMGEGAFQAALNTGREWDVTQTIRYLRSEEGV